MAGRTPAAVPRERLLSRLSAVPADVPVVLLVAPPGYGKTTLLRQWVDRDESETVWVAVEDDRSTLRLLDRVVLALATVAPVGPDVARALSSELVPVRSELVPRLAAALRGRTRSLLLVLDGVQDVPVAELNAVLAVADALPPGSHLVLTARDSRNVPIGVLRARGECVELAAADLALTPEETGQVLAASGVSSPHEAVLDLTARTEGWPVAVYLAAAGAAAGLPAEAVAVPLADVLEFLRDELLVRLDDETVDFLLRSSVLEALSGPLCEAVLAQEGPGARLADVVARNLFLVPLDAGGEWYRYHRLVGEALRTELGRRDPSAESQLLGRAADWCARHGRLEAAVAYALRGGHLSTAAAVVSAHAYGLVRRGRVATVRRWLEAFSDTDLRAQPSLAVVATWVWGLSGSPTRATAALLAAERAGGGPAPEGCTSLESAVRTARAALTPRGVERMLADAQEAFELEPVGSPWRPVASVLLGCARRLNGMDSEAAWPLELAAETGRDVQPWAVQLALAQRSLLAADADDWEQAASCADAARAELGRRPAPENPAAALVHAAAARVAQHRGDDAAARAEVSSAVVLSGRSLLAFPWLSAQTGLVLGQVQVGLGDTDGARHRVEEVRRQLVRLPTEGVLRTWLEELSTASTLAGTDVRGNSLPALSPAERAVLGLLRTHLTLGEIADQLHVSRNTVKSQVASLYRKLDASSRSEALRRARAVGLG